MLSLILWLFDGIMEFWNFIETVFYLFSSLIHLLLALLQLSTVLQQSLVLFLVLKVLLCQRYLFGLYFLLELINLMVDYLIPPLELSNLILSLRQALAVCITIRPDILIQLLLVLQLRLRLYVLLLVLRDEIALELNLLQGLQVFCVGKCSFLPICLLFLEDLQDLLVEGLYGGVTLWYFLLVVQDLFLPLEQFLIVLFELGLET